MTTTQKLITSRLVRGAFITVRNSSCGKVMFLHMSVSHSVHGGGGRWSISGSGARVSASGSQGGSCLPLGLVGGVDPLRSHPPGRHPRADTPSFSERHSLRRNPQTMMTTQTYLPTWTVSVLPNAVACPTSSCATSSPEAKRVEDSFTNCKRS